MNKPKQQERGASPAQPAKVLKRDENPVKDKQAGEVREQTGHSSSNGQGDLQSPRGRWAWTEESVWTSRMLEALEQGVKGGMWFSLIDKVFKPTNLSSAWEAVRRNDGASGVDDVTIGMYERHLQANLDKLACVLKDQTYRPQAVKRVEIPKPGTNQTRPLGIPTVCDRVVQKALLNVIEPIFERNFARHSYGFRPGRSCKDALRRVDELLKSGYRYVVDADLQSYFDTIDHGRLMKEVSKKIADGRVLKLIELFLNQGVMEEHREWKPTTDSQRTGSQLTGSQRTGTPQGGVISPLLSNIFLDELDHTMEQQGREMVRYADDLVILCRTQDEAEEVLEELRQWTTRVGLTLHPTKTRIVDTASDSFEFLGYRLDRGMKFPRDKSMRKLKDSIRSKTRRTEGRSLPCIIKDVNRTMRGWFEYFKHSHRNTFGSIDGWARMRLRSILRKRQGKKGPGRGSDHHRWPNRYFAEQGLYTLKEARARILKPVVTQTC